MNYEKAYKETLEKARAFYETKSPDCLILESIFPELAESEDERIRKELIEALKQLDREKTPVDSYPYLEWVSWLEKQSKTKQVTDFSNIKTWKFIVDAVLTKDKGIGQYLDSARTETIAKELLERFGNIEQRYVLEKQGEQKPDDYLKWDELTWKDINTLEILINNVHYEFRNGIGEESFGKEVLEKFREIKGDGYMDSYKQKPAWSEEDETNLTNTIIMLKEGASLHFTNSSITPCIDWLKSLKNRIKEVNNTEPKFKVGDWITNGDYTWKILEVKPLDYILQSQDGNIVDDTISHIDTNFSLWDVTKNAKDGDVLATEKGNPFLYDKNRYNNELAYYYVGLDVNKELVSKSHHSMLNHFGKLSSIFPATKEQHDILFQKMKEAGYTWDAETKQLIKKIIMTQEEKQLLLQDISARLPYGVKGKVETSDGNGKEIKDEGVLNSVFIDELGAIYICVDGAEYELEDVKPYLRPMESMTEEEKSWYESLRNALTYQENGEYDPDDFNELNDFLNRRKLDRYGLIEKNLALEATKEMYNN